MQSSTIFPLPPSSHEISDPCEKLKPPSKEQWEEDEDFDFTFSCREPYLSPVPADKIFFKGKIKPLYQILSKDYELDDIYQDSYEKDSVRSRIYYKSPRSPGKKFLIEKPGSTSYTSSKADELEGIEAGTCCVWTPKASKKTSSAASFRRWRFKEILRRSKSDGSRAGPRVPSDGGKQEIQGDQLKRGLPEQQSDDEQAILLCGVLC